MSRYEIADLERELREINETPEEEATLAEDIEDPTAHLQDNEEYLMYKA